MPAHSEHVDESHHSKMNDVNDTEVRIASEIAARLLEWRSLSGEARPIEFMERCARLGKENPLALQLACEMVAGSPEILSKKFADLGPTRQAAHQRIGKALRAIRAHWPAATAILAQVAANRPRGPQSSMGLRKYLPL